MVPLFGPRSRSSGFGTGIRVGVPSLGELTLPRVLTTILASFFEKLSESEAIDPAAVEQLKALFQSGKKLRADDVVAIISAAADKAPQ
ncbi:MAG: hypothetical protein R2909_00155 [Gemmatimonadales bacterium]